MICKKCGKILSSTDIYCPDCNEPNPKWTSESNIDKAEFIPSVEDLNLAAYVSGNALSKDFESGAFLRMKDAMLDFKKGKVSSWNWLAFFLAPIYLFYRKNYVFAIIVFVLASIIVTLVKSNALNLICPILQGVFCNYFMCLRYENKLKEAQKKYPDNLEAQREYLARKGGRNIVLTVISALLSAIIILSKL
ncbi:MAG: DUF2628 domain-containing protein [Spirochaetaceae bacterium]|nr:DUF2628 domain-containing protein [Spirochaetaceae bacterium]